MAQANTSRRSSASSRFLIVLLTTLCVASAVSSASIRAAHTEQELSLSSRSLTDADASPHVLARRHGDHGHENEGPEEEPTHTHDMPMEHDQQDHHEHQHMHSAAAISDTHDHAMEHEHEHEHGHGHGHSHHDAEATGLSPASIPDAEIAGSDLRDLPVWHQHKGHGHSHGSGPVLEKLNESLLFRAHGPDPLSYIEWDFGYGLGSVHELRRFTSNADVLAGKPKMGVVGGRWRKLLDEKDPEQRQAIAADLASRLANGKGEQPSRHRGLLIMHVVTAVLSCFVLLPMALVLRAAHSTLAPLVSLLYLAVLAGSMFLSVIYKALSPRLYPDNAHGSMGWAILWISVITLGSDGFRLVGQLWLVIAALNTRKRSTDAWLPANSAEVQSAPQTWRDVVATMLGRKQIHAQASQSYDALEEHALLSEEAQSDAQELDVEKHMRHSAGLRQSPSSSRAGSGSGSPHRVHFDERTDGYEDCRPRGGSVESLVEPVNWVGSGSTAVAEHQPRRVSTSAGARVVVASPTSTACNTPRNSFFGGDSTASPALYHKSIPLWNKQTRQGESFSSPQATTTVDLTHARSSRLGTFRTVFRYTRLVAARSLPVLAFATSYAGLAVYTGSCRGGYKNVCLAHGIKGGIFFWFGLLTFGRYLGAYADCGWAWNKRPTAQTGRNQSGLSKRRRSMPSAEFVECLVIFIYGASNTWMERFGAAPGDPYTIKQIQHISIAVMFWFAGLMGMLLETRLIRNMLSFPIAYHHVAAVPLQEARRRRRSTHPSDNGAEDDLDLLVEAQTQPASYSASFNPFPALVIGVTGVAMAAHHQDYQYEVEIHMLWGQLLAGFALLRCLTYFLLWLRPPSASVLPSRPPTEALAAFSLCCGGLVFMLSSEEVSFAAMRSGYGDFMAILNVAVAVVSLLFCWITALMMLKGWAVRREVRRHLVEEQCTVNRPSNALQLNVADEVQEREPRHMRANVVSSNVASTEETTPVFVLDDEEDRDDDEQARAHTNRA